MEWIEFEVGEFLPPEYRYVLLQFEESEETGMPPSVVVGYLKYAAGDKNCPYFIHPGCDFKDRNRKVTHWCDCLGDDFIAPLWPDTIKRKNTYHKGRRRRWIIKE